MPREWTPEQRAAQAARIRATRPWEKSTGPVTRAGKARCRRNALKHGKRSSFYRDAKKLVALNQEFLRLSRNWVDHTDYILMLEETEG